MKLEFSWSGVGTPIVVLREGELSSNVLPNWLNEIGAVPNAPFRYYILIHLFASLRTPHLEMTYTGDRIDVHIKGDLIALDEKDFEVSQEHFAIFKA